MSDAPVRTRVRGSVDIVFPAASLALTLGLAERMDACRADKMVQAVTNGLPVSIAQSLLESLLCCAPKWKCFAQARASLLGNLQSATSPPSFSAASNKSLLFEWTQIPRQGGPVHAHGLRECINRNGLTRRHRYQNGKLRCTKSNRPQCLIVNARHCTRRRSRLVARTIFQNFLLGNHVLSTRQLRPAGQLSALSSTHLPPWPGCDRPDECLSPLR